MRILIYGAGAMGTSLGVLLTRGGIPCELVTRNIAHVNALKTRGATLIEGGKETVTPVCARLPEEMDGEYDIIFLATRQGKNVETAQYLKPFLSENGAIITVQNGLPEESLASVVGADRIYGAALGWGATLVSAGMIDVTSEEYVLALGAYGNGERTSELTELLQKGKIGVGVGNLKEIRFSKLVVNASLSTLSAISGLTFGELTKKYKKLVLALMRETVAVARADGCKKLVQNGHDIGKLFKNPFAGLFLSVTMKKHRNIRSGMLKDLERGRKCDIDYVAGAVVKAGKRLNVPTPRLSAAVSLVHDIENGFAELSPESLKLL